MGLGEGMKFLSQTPLIGILRGAETKSLEGAVEAAVEAGILTLEITLNRPEAFEQIALIKDRYGDQIQLVELVLKVILQNLPHQFLLDEGRLVLERQPGHTVILLYGAFI